jgi:hypothetical protein
MIEEHCQKYGHTQVEAEGAVLAPLPLVIGANVGLWRRRAPPPAVHVSASIFCICRGCGQSLGPRCDGAEGFLVDRATLHGCVVRCRWRIGGDRMTPGPHVDTGRRQQPLQGPPDGALVEPATPAGGLLAGQRPRGPSWVAPWVASWRWEFTIERVGFRLGSGADLHLDTLTCFAGFVSSRLASFKPAACTFYGHEGLSACFGPYRLVKSLIFHHVQ